MMRIFLLALFVVCALVISIAGCRGSKSGRPPIELFPDMDRQPKLRPQAWNAFFENQRSSQLPVRGTVPQTGPVRVGTVEIYPFLDVPYNTGQVPGTTNFVELLPVPVTTELMQRGRERYAIHCGLCHGAAGDGKGVTAKYQMVGMASFHDKRLVLMPDGEIFNTITHGKNLMGAYGPNVDVADRWAIVAYIRALQRSRLATIDDVPEHERAVLNK
jgi:mono/diheme cytochrome c family protein